MKPTRIMTKSEKSPDGHQKISIWFRPETVEILQRIQQTNRLGVLEDALDWLIQGWQLNQHQHNQCHHPKFWFGQKVQHKTTGIVGQITGIEWRREGRKTGFWYGVASKSLAARWMSEIDLEAT